MITAVLAVLDRRRREKVAGLLREMGVSPGAEATDGAQALEACRKLEPDLAVADEVLPCLDGRSLARALRGGYFQRVPGVVLLTPMGMGDAGRSAGVACLGLNPSGEDLARAVREVAVENRPVPEKTRRYLEGMLTNLDVPEHPGREYLLQGIFLASEDIRLGQALTARLYPVIGMRCGVNARRVERAMSHVIDLAWAGGDIDRQYGIFQNTIDAQRGKPTCGEMIAQLAELTRMEGRI